MREIKFRGRRLDDGRWVTGYYLETPLTAEICAEPEIGLFFLTGEKRHCISSQGVVFPVDPSTVGQFTGLLDKNGKEIYEGDVVRMFYPDNLFIDDTGRIEFGNGCFNFHYLDCDCRLRTKDLNSGGLLTQIAGNIHSNPELLKTE